MDVTFDRLTIEAFGGLFRSGRLSSTQLTEECLRRIAEDASRLNAFTLVMAEEARAQAQEADRERAAGTDRGPLHGVPVSIKDLVDIAGTPTSAASRVREGHVARQDAPVVSCLRRAGAVFVGKTNLHEFAFGTTTGESAFGPALNPFDVTRSPGGSSGGSAISVAAGMALASIGTDTGGSIRIPAAACGVVGLKPSLGEVSTEGVVPLSSSLDHVGPLARSVGDAWLVHLAIGGAAAGPVAAKPSSLLRLAVPRMYFCDVLDDDVRARFEEALEHFRASGAAVHDTRLGRTADIVPVYTIIASAEAAAYHAATLDEVPERYSIPVRMRLEAGRYLLAEDYVRAVKGRLALRKEVDRALSDYDALLVPTLPIPPPEHGQPTVVVGSSIEPVRALMLRQTQLFNLSGHPAISIPCGKTSMGLPCAVQLVGRRNDTRSLVQAALACESILSPHIG
jgi:aspartyl-tRNA(Asn)/glutamyl-tRNA(Gln) amidotransferase subunit A